MSFLRILKHHFVYNFYFLIILEEDLEIQFKICVYLFFTMLQSVQMIDEVYLEHIIYSKKYVAAQSVT